MTALPGILDHLFRMAAPAGGDGMEKWIRRHRLEPMVFGVELPDWTFSERFMEECRQAYFNMIGRSALFAREAESIVSNLGVFNVPSYAWRGVINGKVLYGDPALRYCTDVDVMVSPEMKFKALHVMIGKGYRLRNGLIPKWYLARHHLHWPMISSDGRVPVDVHWAVDHPYKETSPIPSGDPQHDPVAKIIMAILHAEKESRFRLCASLDDVRRKFIIDGPVLPWLDLALMIDRVSDDQWREVVASMGDPSSRTMLERALWICREMFGAAPAGQCADVPVFAESAGGRWVRLLSATYPMRKAAEKIGCRPEAMADWYDYIVSSDTRGGLLARAWRRVTRGCRILLLFAETLVCGLWMAAAKCFSRNHGASMA